MLITEGILTSLNSQLRSGSISVSLLPETYTTLFNAEAFLPFSPFFEDFNAKIHQMITSGLFDLWHRREENPKGLTRKPEDVGPQVLTLEHLQMGFKFSLYPLTISAFVFLIELSILWCKTLINNLIVWNVVKAFIEAKEMELDERRNVEIIRLRAINCNCKCTDTARSSTPDVEQEACVIEVEAHEEELLEQV